MPPEPLPWDRKELRRHEGGGGLGGFAVGGAGEGGPRWRELPFPRQHHPYNNGHHYHGHNNHHHGGGAPPRWLPEFRYRPPSGHGKQGSRAPYVDDLGHGFVSSRTNDKMLEDESCRPSGSGRYCRKSRDSKGSFDQKDCKVHSSENASLPSGPGRPDNISDQRSVDNLPSYNSSHPTSDSLNSQDQSQHKDKRDRRSADGAMGSPGQESERENSINSIDWKSLKWTRSGSFSLRGSGFNNSISSKTMVSDSDDMKVVLMPKDATALQPPSGDAATGATYVASVAPSEETSSRKKPRLGWGEGLAKYEKKKVEGDDSSTKSEATLCCSNSEPGDYLSNMTDKSPTVVASSDCASPATPSSVACSSSPGLEEKQLVKSLAADHDSPNLCCSPGIVSENHSDGSKFNLESLDLTSISHLNSSISQLLHSDEPSSVGSSFVRSTATNKLLVWKNDISKAVEATESEIDLLENELKSLISESESSCRCLAASSSVPAKCDSKPCDDYGVSVPVECHLIPRNDHSAASNVTIRPPALQLVVDAANAPKDDHLALKDVDIDSPGSATSKFSEPPSPGKHFLAPDLSKDIEVLEDSDVNKSRNMDVECSIYGLTEEQAVVLSSHGVASKLVSSSSAALTDDNLLHAREEVSYKFLLASNNDLAHRTSEVFINLLPTTDYHIDISSVGSASCWENDPMKERVLRRKQFLRRKERILTLKFKMFQHLWKEDVHLFSLKKLRAKSLKKVDLSLRTASSYQKHRFSIRSRYSCTAGLSVEPTSEMINYASRLLSEPLVKPLRNVLKMPPMIFDKHERMTCRFISRNGLVEDPCAVEKERTMINLWTPEEKEVFIDKLAEFGKDFKKIASSLDHKTIADCIEFYYKNHKSDSFERAKKKPEFAKQDKSSSISTYLVGPRKRWNCEANAVSLDILGIASAIAAKVDNCVNIHQKCIPSSYKMLKGEDGLLKRSNNLDVNDNERESVAADVLACICGSLSSEAMSSCITSSADPGEGYQEGKYQRVGSSSRRPMTPEFTQNIDDETYSDESCGEMNPSDWTDEEKSIFIRAFSSYGKDFATISRCVRTRSQDQCRVFFSKARKCLGLDMICPGPGNLVRDDVNGGGSDMEDTCVMETGPVICSEKSVFKMEKDTALAGMKPENYLNQLHMYTMKPDLNRLEKKTGVRVLGSADPGIISKDLVSGVEDKPEIDNGGVGDTRNGSEGISVQDHVNVVKNSDHETAAGVGGTYDHDLPNGLDTETQSRFVDAAYVEEPQVKSDLQALVLHESILNVNKVETGMSSPRCFLRDEQPEAHLAGIDSHSDTSSYRQKTDMESVSRKSPFDVLLEQTDCSAPLSMGSRVSSSAKNGKSSNCDPSVVDLAEVTDEQNVNSSRGNGHGLPRNSSVRHLQSSCILRGYPVPVSTMKEMGGDITLRNSIPLQSMSHSDGVDFGCFSARDPFFRRCSSSKIVSSRALPALSSQEKLSDHPMPPLSSQEKLSDHPMLPLSSQENMSDYPRPSSGSLPNMDKACSTGNVKLFGQILSKPSLHKLTSSTQRNEGSCSPCHNVGSKSLNVKSSSNQTVEGQSAPTKYVCSNLVCSETLPLRSFDFWDRNLLRNGFSSLPDSAVLLAKYPSAFGNYATPSSKLVQPALHGVGKNGECSLDGVSVFPTGDINGGNGLACHMYRNQELQPFSIDMRQPHDILLSEMQRRNGYDVASGMQEQSRGVVGVNVVGRGGVVVGGQCSGVSDPVAAIRMHYDKSEQFSGQAGSLLER